MWKDFIWKQNIKPEFVNAREVASEHSMVRSDANRFYVIYFALYNRIKNDLFFRSISTYYLLVLKYGLNYTAVFFLLFLKLVLRKSVTRVLCWQKHVIENLKQKIYPISLEFHIFRISKTYFYFKEVWFKNSSLLISKVLIFWYLSVFISVLLV